MSNSAAAHDYPKFGSEEHAQIAYNAASECVTLLKNDNDVLPPKGENILVAGPAANSLNILNGAWTHTWQGVDEQYNTEGKQTILQALTPQVGNGIAFVECSTLDSITDLDKAASQARNADAIVVCLGELPSTEKPGDIEDLIRSLTPPTLLMWGEANQTAHFEHSAEFRSLLENVESLKFISYPGVGHMAVQEAGEETGRDVRAFLDSRRSVAQTAAQ